MGQPIRRRFMARCTVLCVNSAPRSELGYYTQVEGGQPGQPDGPPLEAQAATQEAAAQASFLAVTSPGYVPSSCGYGGPSAPMWASQLGNGNLPKRGWTVQNDTTGSPFGDYDANVGFIPDWTGDSNPIAAGAYDQNQVLTGFDSNPLNQAPIGDAVLQFDDTNNQDPNLVPNDFEGQIDLTY